MAFVTNRGRGGVALPEYRPTLGEEVASTPKARGAQRVVRSFAWAMLLVVMFPPVPRLYFSTVDKIRVAVAFALAAGVVVAGVARGRLRLGRNRLGYWLFMVFPILPLLRGLAEGQEIYGIVKEFVFLAFPAIVLLAIINVEVDEGDLARYVIRVSLVLSILQIAMGGYGLLLLQLNRYHYRWDCLLLSSDLLPLAMFLVFARARRASDLLAPSAILLYAGIVLTLGREDILCIVVAFVFYFGVKWLRHRFFAVLAVSVFVVAPLIYVYSVFSTLKSVDDTSTLWRVQEWFSFARAWHHADLAQVWFGKGLGATLRSNEVLRMATGEEFILLERFHNFWLYLLFKTGIAGTICVFVLLEWIVLSGVWKGFSGATRLKVMFPLFFVQFRFFVQGNVFGGITMSIGDGALVGMALAFAALAHGSAHVRRQLT